MRKLAFGIVLFVHSLCAIASLPLLVAVMLKIRRKQVMHRNTRLILFTHFLALFIYSLTRVGLNASAIFKLDFLCIPALRCSLRVPETLVTSMLYSSSFYIAIERCVAITNSKNYEKCRSVGVLLVAAKLLTSLSIFIGFYMPEMSIDGLLLFCSKPKRSDLFKLIPCLTVLTFQVLSVIFIRILKYVNQRLAEAERRKPQLRIRYNLDESLRTIYVITPFIYASCIFIFTFMAFITACIAHRNSINSAVYIPLIEGLNWLPEYALLAPLILLYVDRRIGLKKKIDLQQLMNKTTSDDVGRIYFASLVTAWNNPASEDNPHLYRIFPRNSIAPSQ